jgi:hypothetical protein
MQESPPARAEKNQPAEIRVELCMPRAQIMDESVQEAVTGALSAALSDYGALGVSVLPPKPGRSAGLLFTPGFPAPSENGQPGLSVSFGDLATPPEDPDMLQSLSQTWQWDEAEEVVPLAPFRITVRSVSSLELGLNERIGLVQKALYALVELLHPAALIFPQSQCCIEPAAYLENDPAGEDYFSIYGLVNARVFTAEEDDGRNIFMDTLGLHVLGLPDVQCLARDEETDFADLAFWLYNLAEYMRETPGDFEDGDSIVGLNNEEWELNHTASLIGPKRRVLNVNTMWADIEDVDFLAEKDA